MEETPRVLAPALPWNPCFKPNEQPTSRGLTAEDAAERLGVSPRTVRDLLREVVLVGTQVVKFGPWGDSRGVFGFCKLP